MKVIEYMGVAIPVTEDQKFIVFAHMEFEVFKTLGDAIDYIEDYALQNPLIIDIEGRHNVQFIFRSAKLPPLKPVYIL